MLYAMALTLAASAACPQSGSQSGTPATSPETDRPGIPTATTITTASRNDHSLLLQELVAAEWQTRLADQPFFASSIGHHEYDAKVPDVSPDAQEARAAMALKFAARLQDIDTKQLSSDEQVTQLMLLEQLRDRARAVKFYEYETPLNADSGFHTSFARLPEETRLESEADIRNYLQRMRLFPGYMRQQIANMRDGIKAGRVLPKVVMLGFGAQLRPMLVSPESHPFVRALDKMPDGIDAETAEALRSEARVAVKNSIIPAYQSFLEFLSKEYIPAGRSTLGASSLPDGDEYYAYLVRRFTTLDQTPKEVHDRGLAEVARIRADMEAVLTTLIEKGEFEGTFAEFLAYLRSDPRFYAKSPEELLARAARICKDVDAKLPAYFGRLPRQPYGVEPVPDAIAAKYTSGRYVRAGLDSGRAGTYWVNTYDLASRPLYALPALSLHEAVPGHHLQIALNAELDHLPPFRRHAYVTAFGEGWALYTEWLGIEMGIYKDAYQEFGRLTYEMWRAARLVVDTGLHAYGWTRQQAIDYLSSNTALSIHECTTEVDRYISWPGQALAYKTGELEIRALRKEAEARLGADFDLKAFHDQILGSGSVPLSVLRAQMSR